MVRIIFKSIILFTAFLFSSCNSIKNGNSHIVDDNVEDSSLIKKIELGGWFDVRINSEAIAVLVSISDEKGNDLVVNEKLSLRTFGGNQITEPIKLNIGNYKLTAFHVLDKDGNVIYSAPENESDMSMSSVKKTMDIEFKIEKNEVTKIFPKVLATSFKTPEDFGYATFSFEKLNVLQFLISTFIYNEDKANLELTEANIVIKAGSNIIYSNDIEAITNHIIFRDNNYKDYQITITKQGYKTVVNNYTSEELKSKFNNPIMVILEVSKERVFEGNNFSYRRLTKNNGNYRENSKVYNGGSADDVHISSFRWTASPYSYNLDYYVKINELLELKKGTIIKNAIIEFTYNDFYRQMAHTYRYGDVGQEVFIQRVTSEWSNETYHTPTYTTDKQVIIPSILNYQQVDYPNRESFSEQKFSIDITMLLQDMIDNETYTFRLAMKQDSHYCSFGFYSFGYSDLNKRAKIKVTL